MRLDLFLKKCRIIKRRTVAAQMAKSGRIKKDGRPLKPGYELKVNDEIEIAFGNRVMRIKVTDTSNKPQHEIISEIKL
ncbi:MAG: S4 domain-containing protein [Thermotogota bacterium]|nr:S4 domain-containing protein [Thermotogota bacterium]